MSVPPSTHTALHDTHVTTGARMVEFAGWSMPLHYGSQLEEHHAVRRDAGMFDVSHMARIDIHGNGARPFLRQLVANNVDKLQTAGKALYTCMLTEAGGILDDLIIYFLDEQWFRVVVNAATRDKDLAWMRRQGEKFEDLELRPRPDLAMIAVQGPQARDKTFAALGQAVATACRDLPPFHAVSAGDYFIGATGYTGEDGFEIIVANQQAPDTWQSLAQAGVAPCGLGARDTLRLEAGMNLYGTDMDETTTPLESGLAWTVAWQPEQRDFVGRTALLSQRQQGVARKLVGLLLLEPGVMRGHQRVSCAAGTGEVTSGGVAPTLERSIALARLPAAIGVGDSCQVEIRGKPRDAKVVRYPFVRNGVSRLEED